jgi:hypothetical protein
MPRSVRVAVVTSWVIALLGVVALAVSVADFVTGHSFATGWGARVLGPLVQPGLVAAVGVPVAATRRDERARAFAFHIALLASILLGFVAAGALALTIAIGRLDARVVNTFLVLALAVVLASSLSRRSAKAWFTSTTAPPTARL